MDHRALVVATRAAEVALAAGIELSDDLALWHLAGGRPSVEAVAGTPDELGSLLEAAFSSRHRRTNGAHYTPESLAVGVVERGLANHSAPTICDPACGGGALLLAAARHQAALGHEPREVVTRLWGADIDPLAVATTEVALTLWAGRAPSPAHLSVTDTLLCPAAWDAFDVVVGNPPFLSQLDAATARSRREAAELRARFGPAIGAYTDTASIFLLAACSMVRDGGTVAMVQPQSVLAARDGSGVRAAIDDVASVREVWLPPRRSFAAAIEVCVVVLDTGRGRRSSRPWSAHLARAEGVPEVHLSAGSTLGDEAVVAAAFRTEYYGIAPHVHEAADLPDGRPLLTSGLIDLGGDAWGERTARVAGRRWEQPVVDVAALAGRASVWAERAQGPKLIIATQTRVVELVVDSEGRFVPGVPLVVAWAPVERLWSLAAALASPPVNAWATSRAAGTALSPGALKLTASLVRQVPLPQDVDAWRTGTAALQHGEPTRFAEAMTAAYGCSPDVARWWLERLGSVWRPRASSR